MNWHTAAEKKEYEMSDYNVDHMLEAVIAGDVGKELSAVSSIIWKIKADCFGKKELKVNPNNLRRSAVANKAFREAQKDHTRCTCIMKGSGDDSGGYMEEVHSLRLAAKVYFIPRMENSTDINQFPTISMWRAFMLDRGFLVSLFVLSIENKNQ